MAEGRSASPSDYLAAERTFLAWIRTGLALMGFGFVVARFGLFLRGIAMITRDLPLQSTGASLWMGTGLLLVGVVVNVAASIKSRPPGRKPQSWRQAGLALGFRDRRDAHSRVPRAGVG